MCGIFGIINSVNCFSYNGKQGYSGSYLKNAADFVIDAGMASAVRGIHSTGVYGIKTSGTSFYHKKAISPAEFFATEQAKEIVTEGATGIGVIGHVRHATSGDADNPMHAHPFCVSRPVDDSSIVGVHNGTLYGWDTAPSDALGCEVDSEWIYKRIANEGYSAIDDFYGAFALVWWDMNDPTAVYMCRNDERPLHFAMTKDGRHMLYASEARMIAWIADRNNIDIEDNIYSVPSGKVWRIDSRNHMLDFEEVHSFDAEGTSWYKHYRTSASTSRRSTSRSSYTHPYYAGFVDDHYPDEWETVSYTRRYMIKAIKDRYSQWENGETQNANSDDETAEMVLELDDFAPRCINHIGLSENQFSVEGLRKYEIDAAKDLGIYGKVFNFTPIDSQTKQIEGVTYLTEHSDKALDGYCPALMINAYSAYDGMPLEDLPIRYSYGVAVGVQDVGEGDDIMVILSPIFPNAFEAIKDNLFMTA